MKLEELSRGSRQSGSLANKEFVIYLPDSDSYYKNFFNLNSYNKEARYISSNIIARKWAVIDAYSQNYYRFCWLWYNIKN